jgi:hypothetical protein
MKQMALMIASFLFLAAAAIILSFGEVQKQATKAGGSEAAAGVVCKK